MEQLKLQQEHNLERAFMLRKEVERMNREKEALNEKKKLV